MKLKFQYGSNGPIGRQLAAWQNSLFPGYVSFRRLQFHHQNRLIISLINKGANTWIITQPPYSHNFCRSKTAINNRELLYLIVEQNLVSETTFKLNLIFVFDLLAILYFILTLASIIGLHSLFLIKSH